MILTDQLNELLRDNPRAMPMVLAPAHPNPQCANCNDVRAVAVAVLGKYLTAPQGKCKWFDLPPSDNPQTPSVSGWYEAEIHYDHCPLCTHDGRIHYLIANCNLQEQDRLSLRDFRTDTASTRDKSTAKQAVANLLSMDKPGGFVTLYGNYGVGKTHLLKAAVWGFVGRQIHAQYYVLPDLIAYLQSRYTDSPGAVEYAIEAVRNVPVLAIDELDKLKLTDWSKQTVFRLLDYRYNLRNRLLTIIATNLPPQDYESGYMASRMQGGAFIEVGGADIRQAQGYRATTKLTDASRKEQKNEH